MGGVFVLQILEQYVFVSQLVSVAIKGFTGYRSVSLYFQIQMKNKL